MEDKGSKGGRTRKATAKSPEGAAPRTAAAKPAPKVKEPAAKKAAAPRKTASGPAAAKVAATSPDRAELVRMAAYFRAEQRGFAPGYEIEDWLAAEAEVAEKLGDRASVGAPDKAAARKR
jgi:hypothetical protein